MSTDRSWGGTSMPRRVTSLCVAEPVVDDFTEPSRGEFGTLDNMQLWTIQTEQAWATLNQRGRLRCRRSDADRDFLSAYDWMADQMRTRIGSPSSRVISVPIWAWFQYEGIKRKRPDLRASGHLPSGTRGYRIALEIPDEHVVLSDFELWHYVLNYWYLPCSEVDNDAFCKRHPNFRNAWSEPCQGNDADRIVRESWVRIFDLQRCDPYVSGPPSQRSIQATMWEIELPWVTAADDFVAR